jgi:small subunit ribosomal protein S4
MVNHGHFFLNGVKHNIPSTFLKPGDKIIIKTQLQDSVLYNDILTNLKVKSPSWIKIDKNSHAIEVLTLPQKGEL